MYVAISVNRAASYRFDDVSLKYVAGAPAPEGTFELAKVDAPVSTFSAVHVPFTSKLVLHNQPDITDAAPYSVGVIDLAGAGAVSGVGGAWV